MSRQLKPFLFGSPIDQEIYTDPISNTIVLPNVDIFKASRNVASGVLPMEYLNAFLHEATHHICFFTPVGRSLAALSVSAAGESSPNIANEETFKLRRRDVLKLYCFKEFFGPLLEGLAVFAQFDAFPADSPLISDIAMKASYVFAPKGLRQSLPLGPLAGKWDYIRKLFFKARFDDSWFSSKSEVLSLGLDHPEGYLLGYLFVKGYWLQLIKNCRKLLDTDFFLSFMISYWFYDAYFAELIIKDTGDVAEDINNVWAYFQDRIPHLTRNVSEFVLEFENTIASASPNKKQHRPSYCNRDRVNEVILIAQQNLRAVGKYDVLNWDLFGNRQFFRFATSTVDIEVTSGGCFTVRDKKAKRDILQGEAMLGSLKPQVGLGSIEAIIQPDGQILICIFCGLDFVAVFNLTTGEWNEESLLWMGETMLSNLEVEKFLYEIEEHRKHYRSSWGNLLQHNIAGAKDVAYKKYSAVGLTDKDGKYDFGRISLLRKNGFIDVFDQNYDLLDFASKVSLIAVHGFTFAKLASLLKLQEDHFRDRFNCVQDACLRKLNIDPFFTVGDRLKGSLL